MIDISKSDHKSSSINSIAVILLAIGLGYLFWNQPKPGKDRLDVPDSAVVIDAEGMASSTLLDQWAIDQDIELRRIGSASDLTNAESWVKLLAEKGQSRSPCVVVAKNGEITIIPISDNLIDAVDALSADD